MGPWPYIAIKALLFIVFVLLKYHKKGNVTTKPIFETLLPAKILFPWTGSHDARPDIQYELKSLDAALILCDTLKETLSSKTIY